MTATPMLTAAQRKRLAKEARKLAMECLDGTAPEFAATSFCGCAIGEILAREGGRPAVGPINERWLLANAIDDLDDGVVSCALIQAGNYPGRDRPAQQHAALVFPLLALADVLEEPAPEAQP